MTHDQFHALVLAIVMQRMDSYTYHRVGDKTYIIALEGE